MFKLNKKIHCPHCYNKFSMKDVKSIFIKNKTLCPKCKRWVCPDDKISNKIEHKEEKLPTQFKQYKTHKTNNPKYIPNSVWPNPDVMHFCKIDYYNYDMIKATGSKI